jgi:hypothetical protein
MSRVLIANGLLVGLLLAGCGGGGETGLNVPVANSAPVAAVSVPGSVARGANVTLDGSGSTDADADVLSYAWTLSVRPAGSNAVLDSSTSAKPSFVADIAGAYTLTLVVDDGKAKSAPLSITVTALAGNLAPTANAGVAQSQVTGARVHLDGSASSDPDAGDTLSYRWSLTPPAGSSALLDDAGSAAPTFSADRAGSYVAALVVSDGHNDSAPATVTITVSTANAAPVANAGAAQSVRANTPVTLSGAASSDANGDALSYAWTLSAKPSGSQAVLSAPASAAPSFTPELAGSYVATLVVNDGQVNSAPASVTISASAANAAPVANAGPAQSVSSGTLVTLSGAASSDANGDPLTYLWTLTTRPVGSSALLSVAMSASPSFPADVAGAYVATLVVNDGLVNSAPATVTISATDVTRNAAPLANAGSAQSAVVGSVVSLSGAASSDEDGDPLSYRWTLTARPTGSVSVLSGADTVAPSFNADIAGSYVATLVVNDGMLDSLPSTVTVTASVGNAAPIADAGAAQDVKTGQVVTLDGSGSSDANGDALAYSWTLTGRPAGSAAVLPGATTVRPTFTPDVDGAYVATLIVNDGKVNSSNSASVTVRASTPPIGLPVEQLMTAAAFGDVEFDWGRDGLYCGTCNFGASNARFNWVDHSNRLWVANVDPDTGAIIPSNGRGVLVDNAAVYFTEYGNGPEWAFSSAGSQLLYTRFQPGWVPTGTSADDDHVGIGFAKMAGGAWQSGMLDGVLKRNLPAPTQTVTDSAPYIAYANSTNLNFYWRKLGATPGPEVLTRFQTVGLSIRWLPGTAQFVYADGVKPPGGDITYQQIFFYDTQTGVPPVQLTFDPLQKRGAFMFQAPEFGGEWVFFTVADRTELRIYRQLPDANGVPQWTVIKRIYSPNADEPYIASPEPFTYNGRTWLFMTLSRSSSASDVTIPTSLAVTGIDPAVQDTRALTDSRSLQRLRQDPEYFITSKGAYIYYSRALPGTDTSGPIHEGYFRVDTGLGAPVGVQGSRSEASKVRR